MEIAKLRQRLKNITKLHIELKLSIPEVHKLLDEITALETEIVELKEEVARQVAIASEPVVPKIIDGGGF